MKEGSGRTTCDSAGCGEESCSKQGHVQELVFVYIDSEHT